MYVAAAHTNAHHHHYHHCECVRVTKYSAEQEEVEEAELQTPNWQLAQNKMCASGRNTYYVFCITSNLAPFARARAEEPCVRVFFIPIALSVAHSVDG